MQGSPYTLNSTNSVFEVQPDIETINQTLAIISSRIVDQGNCIKFKNKYWMAYDKEHNRIPLRPKMEVLVIESFDQKDLCQCDGYTIHLRRSTSV